MVSQLVKRAYSYVSRVVPEHLDERIRMWHSLGYVPNLRTPRTFNEHIGNRKLFNRDPRFAQLADKWLARRFVARAVGEEYLIPVYQLVTDPREIEFSRLPNSFVVKGRHDWGTTIVVDDKNQVDVQDLLSTLESVLESEHGGHTREYWYSEIPKGILVEERLSDEQYDIPLDFKFFVFHGTTRLIEVNESRLRLHTRRYYDRSWTPLDVTRPGDVQPSAFPRPRLLSQMLQVAERLGQGFDFVRIDLYAPDDRKLFFGEFTFAPEAGRLAFIPSSFDWELGQFWSRSL